MKLPTLSDFDFSGKMVAVRVDLDVNIDNGEVVDDTRLSVSISSLEEILEKGASKLYILGHRGRPESYDEKLSTAFLVGYFAERLEQEIGFTEYKEDSVEYLEFVKEQKERVVLLENIRFWQCEVKNCPRYSQKLAELADIYVNESFAGSHREHTSVCGAMKIHLESKSAAFGLRFIAEIEHLNKVLENPKKPVVFLLSGVKEDKLKYLDKVIKISDKVLVSGRLPKYIDENYSNPKVVVAKLIMDNEDITIHSMEDFEAEIRKAGTIVVSGPMGKFEDEGHRQGTKRVLEAVANSSAYKVAGGGDTEHALSVLGLKDKFDWVSVGGGAMLEYLVNGSLPILTEVVN